ncbi:SCP2 sterol-binding domain-containing protein [uncultured Aliiroseovarius sp.]|uniref:SCP2 sterol-binding domain-containing protein n=1 Tax=uncultured Aliiroseovarius sp. TaxID=1658783 RepID=UPI002591AB37|nr:SCP2 sterol-binding domain-containing protein [uncultured Aliiroseovarius sp.]
MSDVINAAVTALNEKMEGGFDGGTAKFVLNGEGSIMVDGDGARAGDEDADVTLTADRDVFEEMLAGELNPTTAFMSGKLSVDGNMGLAMQLGAALS